MNSNYFFAFVIGLIVANQVASRSATFRKRKVLFWGLQAINVGLAIYVFIAGVPGIHGQYAGYGKLILGLLFLFRAAQNMLVMLEADRERKLHELRHMNRDVSYYELSGAANGSGYSGEDEPPPNGAQDETVTVSSDAPGQSRPD